MLAVLLGLLFPPPLTGRAEETTAEPDDAKVVLLTRIVEFITWPEGNGATDRPTRLCFLSANALGGRWRLLEGSKSKTTGSPFEARLIAPASLQSVAEQCQVLFVDRESEVLLIREHASLANRPVLTVGESERFIGLGGMVSLIIQGERLQFDINLPPLKTSGLDPQSALLGLARHVRVEKGE